MKSVPIGKLRRALGPGALLACLATPALSAETELTYRQLRDYVAQPGVNSFVPHAIAFEGSRYYLVTGNAADDGACRFTELLSGRTDALSATRGFGSVDLAANAGRCEKLVERGYYAASGAPGASGTVTTLGGSGVAPAVLALGSWQKSAKVPFASAAGSGVAAPLALPGVNAGAATIHSAGLYTEWNYGGTPALGSTGSSLVTSSIDSSIQLPSDLCKIGGQYAWNTQYAFNPLLGYVIDTSYPSRAVITAYCNSTRTLGYAENRGYYRAHNPGLLGQDGPSTVVPVCVNAAYNTYEPNRIRVYTDGRYEAAVYTYWSGWRTGCGEFLRSSSSVHRP